MWPLAGMSEGEVGEAGGDGGDGLAVRFPLSDPLPGIYKKRIMRGTMIAVIAKVTITAAKRT